MLRNREEILPRRESSKMKISRGRGREGELVQSQSDFHFATNSAWQKSFPAPDPPSSDCSDVDVQGLLLLPCSCSSDLLQPPRRDLHVSVDVAHLHEEVINAPEEEEPGHAEGD